MHDGIDSLLLYSVDGPSFLNSHHVFFFFTVIPYCLNPRNIIIFLFQQPLLVVFFFFVISTTFHSDPFLSSLLGGMLYTATTSNFLGTLFDISRATGIEQERIRTERSINWLSGKTHRDRIFTFCFCKS